MKITKDLNTLTKSEFITIFGSIFEKSEWIANETFELKPFKNSKDLVDKMINIYDSCSVDKILKILNLHPKLAIEKKLSSFSSKEQTGAELDKCTNEEYLLFNKMNNEYKLKFDIPFIYAVKGANKIDIINQFKKRLDNNNIQEEFNESIKQVKKIAYFRLSEIVDE